MLSRTWKIVLLVVALAAMIWPDLIGTATWWVSLAAVTVLLIGELACNDKRDTGMAGSVKRAGTSRRRISKRRR